MNVDYTRGLDEGEAAAESVAIVFGACSSGPGWVRDRRSPRRGNPGKPCRLAGDATGLWPILALRDLLEPGLRARGLDFRCKPSVTAHTLQCGSLAPLTLRLERASLATARSYSEEKYGRTTRTP
jgi:hypothetical protein